jgi:hypothetical protein
MMGWQGRGCKQLLDDLKKMAGYWKLKQGVLDCNVCVENLLWKRLWTCCKKDYRMYKSCHWLGCTTEMEYKLSIFKYKLIFVFRKLTYVAHSHWSLAVSYLIAYKVVDLRSQLHLWYHNSVYVCSQEPHSFCLAAGLSFNSVHTETLRVTGFAR